MYSIQRASLNGCTNLASNGEELKFPFMWRSKKIGDILKMSIGSTPPKKEDNYNGDIPWVTISNLTTKDIKQYTAKVRPIKTIKKLPAGSLVGSFKMSVGRFGFLSEPSATNEAIIAIPPDATKENLMFLYYALPSVFKKNATLNGQGVPLLNTETIKKLDVILPPLAEQTAIANILSDQEALIAQYDNLIELHEKRFAYLSDELLSGRVRLVQKEVGEVELVKNHQWQNGSNEQVPQNWKHSLLGDIVKIERGTAMNRSKCTPGMVPVIAGGKKPAYYHNVANRKGPTITISASGSAGYVAYYEEDIFASDCSTISESKNYYLPYVYLFLLHQQDEIYRAKKGGAQPHVSPKDLNVLHFMEPPIEEQTLIANVLSDQKALIAQYKKLRDAEKKRFDWLSDALLSGTYRVKVEA